jgi:hypothetical protein
MAYGTHHNVVDTRWRRDDFDFRCGILIGSEAPGVDDVDAGSGDVGFVSPWLEPAIPRVSGVTRPLPG